MDPDAQDILGQPTLPVMDNFDSNPKSFPTFKVLLTLVTLGGGWVAYMWIRREVLIWREKSFKLATRRRHGIPDNDRRPFNVAYAAAMLAKEEREKNERSKPLRPPPARPPVQDHSAPQLDSNLRNRADRYRSATTMPFPGAYTSNSSLGSLHESPQQPQTNAQPSGSRHAARRIVDLSSEVEQPQRGFDDSEPELDEEARKSTGLDDDDEVMADSSDFPEEAGWEDYDAALSHQRPQKRGLGDSENHERKRARKVPLVPEEMEVDEEQDELRDLHSPVRGKKRDRAEAGSTFGGDDDDSAAEDEKLRRRRRKRRTEAKRKSDVAIGKKRDRDMDVDDDLDSSAGPSAAKRKRKKGKRFSRTNGDRDDISVDGSYASTGSRSRRSRTIGEEWESNGVRYKLSHDGRRLQQALVKKARNKFVMPKDSEHPDRDENLQVFVETWLTEEEYQQAKEEKLLAWQDAPKKELETLSVKIPTNPNPKPTAPVGKQLLWTSSTVTPGSSPASISPLDSPALRGSGLRTPGRGRYSLGVNPFEKQPDISTKRIVSASIMNQQLSTNVTPAGTPGLTDTTNVREPRPRTLSKWERQELEAEAIMRLRHARQAELDAAAKEKADKEQREKELKERLERERLERERQEKERQERQKAEMERQERERKEKAAQAAVVVPKITVTTPSLEGIKAPAAPGGFSFAPSATPTTETKPASGTAAPANSLFGAPKPDAATPTATKGGFSFAVPGAPASAATPTAATGGFSFGGAPKPEEKKTETKSAFAFPSSSTTGGAPSAFGSTAPSTSTSATGAAAATAKPKFDFFSGSKPAESSSNSENKPAAPAPAAGGSAFSFSKPAAAATTTAAPAANGEAPAASPFSFSGATSTTNGTTGSVFGAPAAANGTSGSVFGSTTKPGSAFGQSSGAGASSSNAPSGSSSALGGALGSNNAGANAFGFGGADKGKATGFGAFGAPTSTSTTDKGKTSAFGAFGASASTSTSAFGSSAKPGESVFGATSKPAGNAAAGSSTTTTTQPKFSFAVTGATPNTAATSTPKAPSAFGGGGAFGASNGTTTTPAGAPAATSAGSGFSFNFGGAGAGAKPAATGAPAPAAGGAGGFAFGTPANQMGGNVFGAPNANQTGGNVFGTTTTPAGKPNFSFVGKK